MVTPPACRMLVVISIGVPSKTLMPEALRLASERATQLSVPGSHCTAIRGTAGDNPRCGQTASSGPWTRLDVRTPVLDILSFRSQEVLPCEPGDVSQDERYFSLFYFAFARIWGLRERS